MPNSEFSQAVLVGLRKHGIDMDEVGRMTGLSVAKLQKILDEKSQFTYSHLQAIECETGMTPGEFALLACENPEPSFVKAMMSLAAIKSPALPANRRKPKDKTPAAHV